MNNKNEYCYLRILPAGYGHWIVTINHRGRQLSAITTNSEAIDDFSSRDSSISKSKRAYKILRSEVLRKYELK